MSPDSLRLPTCSLLCLLAATALEAQPPSNWTTVPMPATAITAPNAIGTTVSFQTSDSAWLFSGITKEWTVIPVTNPTPIFQANDYCIVQDGNTIHGYASHTGKVDTIVTSASPVIVSGSATSSWVTLVADGTTAWAFGAFHGEWESITLSQPNPTMVASRLLGMLLDGTTAYAVSAHHGTFVPVAADANAVLTVVGEAEVGTANSPGFFRAFSAQHNVWGVAVVPQSVSSLQEYEFAMLWSGAQAWAFSGLSATFDTYTASAPILGVSSAEGVAAFVDGNEVVCYGSGRGKFVTRPASSPTLHCEYHFVLVDEGTVMTPFSAITGAYGPTIAGSGFTIQSNDAAAFVEDGSTGQAYSPILNTWTPAPALVRTAVHLVRDSVVLELSSSYMASSARYGTWVPRTTTLPGSFMTRSNSSTFVAFDGAGETAHVFDARLNRWATVVGQAPLTMNISRHTVMAHDGQQAFGFGQPSGEWYTQPLTAFPSVFDTASSIGAVIHGTQLSTYSVQGSFSYTGRYPEFTQAINLGNTLTLHQVAPPGSALWLMLSARSAYIDVGALGRLYLDPAVFMAIPWPQLVDPDGILDLRLNLPTSAAFVGTQPHLQTLVLPPTGQPWLASSVAPVLF